MAMETYRQMKERHQREVKALPLAFEFSRAGYLARLTEWNITEEEADNGAVIGIGGGAFIRSGDKDLVNGTLERIFEEEQAAIAADMTGDGFIYQMFLYELNNHEFGYTQDADETLSALGISAEALANSEALRHGLHRAMNEINGGRDPFDN